MDNWIDPEVELPKEMQYKGKGIGVSPHVQVYVPEFKNKPVITGFYTFGEGGGWVAVSTNALEINVTHWQPFAEPPKL